MLFLGLVSDWLSKAGDAVEGTIMKAIRTMFYALDTLVYRLIINLYDMFEALCSARLLSSDVLKQISNRIGLVLGLVMLFYVIFGFIQMLLDPDKINNKEKGAVSIIKKVILVIVMLGVSDFVFNMLYKIQSTVVESHVISRLLLPYSIEVTVGNETTEETRSVMDNKKFGSILSEELLHTFYYLEDIDDNSKMSSSDISAYSNCQTIINSMRLQIVNYKRFDLGYSCLNESVSVQYKIDNSASGVLYSEEKEMNVVYFNWLFSLVCGVAVAYLMLMYCFKVGVRMVQLMFLEIISPMTFVSYLSPKKDNMFSKWTKLYFSTYVDLFIRIAIINFVFFLIAALFSNNTVGGFDFWSNMDIENASAYTKGFYVVVIVIALLTFAHKAPDLLKSLLPEGASKLGFGVQSPKDFFKDITSSPLAAPVKVAAKPIGLLAGKTLGGIDSALAGQGFFKGWRNVHGKFGTWFNKQREQYMPYNTERRKQRSEGSKEVRTIEHKWNDGVEVARRLMQVTQRRTGGADDGKYSDTKKNAWNKVLNGDHANKEYYKAIFKNENFINSKMNVDRESGIEDDMRRGFQQLQAGGTFTWNGTTYNSSTITQFSKIYEGQQKKVEGMKAVHDSMRKQYQNDAMIEDQFKFIKGNEVNPASPGNTYSTNGIR